MPPNKQRTLWTFRQFDHDGSIHAQEVVTCAEHGRAFVVTELVTAQPADDDIECLSCAMNHPHTGPRMTPLVTAMGLP